MGTKYKAYDILTIAEQVERNGAAFYRRAAEMFGDAELRVMLFRLADWEVKHEETFANMKRELADDLSDVRFFDPDNYMSANPQVMASLAAFAIRRDPASEISGSEDREEIEI